nr:MAG TPA: hypothetical protein [Caudoviricetes sp.]
MFNFMKSAPAELPCAYASCSYTLLWEVLCMSE